MGNLAAFATGLTNSISGYINKQTQDKQDLQQEQAKYNIDNPQQPGTGSQVSYMTPDMAEKALPGYGAQMVNDYNQRNPQNPMTISQASDFLGKAQTLLNANNPDTSKQDNQQDKLEKQYHDSLTQVRGDQSLMRSEAQRDASGLAYDTIVKAQSEGRPLSQVEYTDLLGQLWKVRTGSSPTEQVLRDIDQKTLKEGFNRAATYFSGNPNLVGATTDDTLNNIKQFVQSSGQKADQQWNAYMQPRMNPPSGLNSDRVAHVQQGIRGISFADQQKVSDKTYPMKAKNRPSLDSFNQ